MSRWSSSTSSMQLRPALTHGWRPRYAFQNSGKDLQVTIRQNVKFNDGSSFGPADVAATFKMLENPKADTRAFRPRRLTRRSTETR